MAHDTGRSPPSTAGPTRHGLLIVDGDGEVLAREMRITRLGEGVDATHKLSADAMARTVAVLGSTGG